MKHLPVKPFLLTCFGALGLLSACAQPDEIQTAQTASLIDAAYEAPALLSADETRLSPQALPLPAGYKVQDLRVSYMSKDRDRAGYKIAAASPATQAAFGLDAPISGVLFKDMLLHNGSAVSVSSGAGLVYEADMIVRVASDTINEAETTAEIAQALDEGYVFIELADILAPKDMPFHGGLIAATNAGARWGIIGDAFAIQNDEAFLERLSTMRVTTRNEAGQVLHTSQGTERSENPLASILFLTRHLSARGESLSPGDYISVGSFSLPAPAPAGTTLIVEYEGLGPGALSASVTLTE